MAQWIFLILCQNVELNSVIQPVETICEKFFRSEVNSGQRCTENVENHVYNILRIVDV